MYGEMLRAGWVQDEARRQAYYDFIFFESERLSRLIANVLQLARLTNHDAPLDLKEYHPALPPGCRTQQGLDASRRGWFHLTVSRRRRGT